MIQVQVNAGKMASMKAVILRAFQDAFSKLLNRTIVTNKAMVVNVVCVYHRKGAAHRQGKILIGTHSTNSLFVEYQHTDNGTCYQYRVIVPPSWIKPEELRQKLIHALEKTTTAVNVEVSLPPKPPKSFVPAFVPSPAQVSPAPLKNHQKKDVSLRGFTKDPDAVEILLIDLREVAKDGIVTRGVVMGYLTPIASNAYSASQVFRRLVEADILVPIEGNRYKLRTESKGEVTLATKVMELKVQFEKFEAVSESIKQAESKIGMFTQRKLIIEEELAKINEELEREDSALKEIRSQVAPGSALAKAREAFLEIQKALLK